MAFSYLSTHFFKLTNTRNYLGLIRLRNLSSNKTNNEENEYDIPIRYSTSPASKWMAKTTRSGIRKERLWYEPHVILASITVFMLYFTIYREENYIDMELERTLYSRISGLEEKQLQIVLDYNEQHGLETKDIISRLNTIEKDKQK